jgi:alkylation response protein AidB-like acyl-CoA dehydrogenase
MAELAADGWSALPVPAKFGGDGASVQTLTVVHEALARHSLTVGQAYYSLWVLGAEAVARLGSSEQQEHWLPRISAGTAQIAFALTEPGSGSDAAALRTLAATTENGYRVSGQKVFVTGAAVSDVIVTAVRTDPCSRHDGISLLLIDPRRNGVTIRPMSKLGIKALDLCEVYLDDVEVDRDGVLGTEHKGWSELRPGLARERVLLAAIAAGGLRDVLERSLTYAKARTSFGQPIGSHQLVAAKLVTMRINYDAAIGLIERAARMADLDHPDAAVAAAEAKVFATESYVSATREGIQVHGGYGYTEEFPMARHYRDAKYLEIGGGTSEIQRVVIARGMGLHI